MKILLAVVGGLLLLIFPFIVMKKAKVTKEEIGLLMTGSRLDQTQNGKGGAE